MFKKIKFKLFKTFHNCKIVRDVYPNNKGTLRLVQCEECGKYSVVDVDYKTQHNIRLKRFNSIYIYIKNKKGK